MSYYRKPPCERATPEEREQLRAWNAAYRHPAYGWILPQIRFPAGTTPMGPVRRRRYLFKQDDKWWIRRDVSQIGDPVDMRNVKAIHPGPYDSPDVAVAAMILAGWQILDSRTANV